MVIYHVKLENDCKIVGFVWRFGSITQSSTVRLGSGPTGEDVHVPLKSLLPMVNPDNIVVDGWDISGANLAEATERAQVLQPALQQQLRSQLALLKPRPSIFDPSFIAANQVSTYILNAFPRIYIIICNS